MHVMLAVAALLLGPVAAHAQSRFGDGIGVELPVPLLTPPVDSTLTPRTRLFYTGADYGSEASFGVVSILLNRGLHFARAKTGSIDVRRVLDGRHSLFPALRYPIRSIEENGGFKHWAWTQLVPLRFDRGSGWVSNYFGHVMEGGIAFRALSEQLEASGVAHPRLWAGVTHMSTSLLNELVEGMDWHEAHSSHVADFYIFEPLAMVVFSQDGVARFFAEDLNAMIWPHQAAISLDDGFMMNTGLDLVMKFPLPKTQAVSGFARFGMGNSWGLSVAATEDLDVSLGVGFDATRARLDPIHGDEIIDTVVSASLFIDRDDSLLASIQGNAGDGRRLAVNLYPGSLGFLTDDFGAWLVVTAANEVQFGISHRALRGMGAGW